jgi:phosphohistidine phosphatase
VTKTLLLLRHARASARPGTPDVERPLEETGRRDARALGEELARRRTVLGTVVASTALRARDTAHLVLAAAGLPPSLLHLEPRIYEAGAATLLRVVQDLPERAGTALLVGHNPGLEDLVSRLAPGGAFGMAPCALVAIDLAVQTWQDAAADAAAAAWRWTPRGP